MKEFDVNNNNEFPNLLCSNLIRLCAIIRKYLVWDCRIRQQIRII
jgi:hypothetical protein